MQEIIGLQQRVIELDEVQALTRESFSVRLVLEELIDAKVPTNVSQESNIVQAQKPVGVIEHERSISTEIQEARELSVHAIGITLDLCRRQQLAHLGLAARIPDHGRPAADQGDRAVASALQVGQHHDADQIA